MEGGVERFTTSGADHLRPEEELAWRKRNEIEQLSKLSARHAGSGSWLPSLLHMPDNYRLLQADYSQALK